MTTLKNNDRQPVISIQKSSTTLDFVITNKKRRIICTLESLLHLGNDIYVVFRDMAKNIYAYLIQSPYSDRPLLVEPSYEIQHIIIEQYQGRLCAL